MARQTPQPYMIQSKLSQMTGAPLNATLAETQQQRRCQVLHRDAAIVATEICLRTHIGIKYVKPDTEIIGTDM
jgi:hypothetical protein